MESLFDDIAGLLEALEANQVRSSAPVADLRGGPSLLFRADDSGRILAHLDLRSQHGFLAPSPAALAAQLAARLARDEDTVVLRNGDQTALAARVPECVGGGFLGCVFRSDDPRCQSLKEEQTVSMLAATFAWAETQQRIANGRLATRIRHLLAEREMLKVSHTEALSAAIEERESRLREQEAHTSQLQAVMMMAADGIVLLDEHGTVESFNEAAVCIFGYAPQEVIGKNISLLIPPPHREGQDDEPACPIQGKVFAAGAGFDRDVTGRRKDGTLFPLDLAVSDVRVGERRIFTAILRDITERKRAEEDLKRLHQQNQMILNAAGEGIVGVDRTGNAIFVNPAAARLLGYEVDDLIGQSFHDMVHHSRPDGTPCPREQCPIYQLAHSSTAYPTANQVFWRKDGGSFPIEYTSTEIQENGAAAGLVITFRDISERRMLEAQLRQAQKLESIGQLAAGIAHEINTPTQYIGDNTRFLADAFRDIRPLLTATRELGEADDDAQASQILASLRAEARQADMDYLLEEIPKAISQSLDGVQRVATIVRSMKEFSHPGGEEMQAIDLNRAIESTLTVSRNEWKYVADAVVELDRNLPLVTCQPGDINQVVLNLIVNAAHAIADRLGDKSQEKGKILVRTQWDGDWVEIRVQDNGTGIPAEIRSRVYDPFFTTKAVGRGTGQGLAIAHSIIRDRHHGTIHFVTEHGKGTTFIIRLPIHANPAPCGEPLP